MALNTQLSLRLRDNPTAAKHFSLEQLNALEKSFLVVAPDQAKPVFYGDSPPSDRNQPWQQTLADGVTPVGEVLLFQGGEWRGGSPCGPVSPTPPWTAPAPIPTPEPDPTPEPEPEPDSDFPGPYWSDGPGDPTPGYELPTDPTPPTDPTDPGGVPDPYPSSCTPGDWCVHDIAWLPNSGTYWPDNSLNQSGHFEFRVFNDTGETIIVHYVSWGALGSITPTPSGLPSTAPVTINHGASVLFTIDSMGIWLGVGPWPVLVYVSPGDGQPGENTFEPKWFYLPE
jgi:hypothetical protein